MASASFLLVALALAGCAGTTNHFEVAAPAITLAPATASVRTTPVSMRIPAIKVATHVGSLGLNADKTVQVPSKPMQAGWYRYGPAPGQAGSAVILGHVDSKTGPAVFARLKELRAGDKVTVTMANHSVVRYAVTKVATYANAKFPARKVYGATGPSTLNLVTCGGSYDKSNGGYQSNVVVYTSLALPTKK
ncbi:MAG TPA: class F sortase [Sporichthyaceae bacterium]|nr:class F sortase [Sporichthyaceae bacterium]